MPLVHSKEILAEARRKKYGIPSLLAGNLEMVVAQVKAAEARQAPLILAFNQAVTPQIPMGMGFAVAVEAAKQATVPVATILDHGGSLEEVMQAIHFGSSSVMFDGSNLPYEENVKQTQEVVRIARAVDVCVEAELGSVGGSAVEVGVSNYEGIPEGSKPEDFFTDPDVAVDFVARTGIDILAISFGNAHGVYGGAPDLDLDRVQKIASMIDVPLVMHGASGLAESDYPKIVNSGISKVCYYTAMGLGATNDIKKMLMDDDEDTLVYHHIIARAFDYFYEDTKRLLDLLGCSGTVK
jgi:fructose-bisphosphate aldolase class II